MAIVQRSTSPVIATFERERPGPIAKIQRVLGTDEILLSRLHYSPLSRDGQGDSIGKILLDRFSETATKGVRAGFLYSRSAPVVFFLVRFFEGTPRLDAVFRRSQTTSQDIRRVASFLINELGMEPRDDRHRGALFHRADLWRTLEVPVQVDRSTRLLQALEEVERKQQDVKSRAIELREAFHRLIDDVVLTLEILGEDWPICKVSGPRITHYYPTLKASLDYGLEDYKMAITITCSPKGEVRYKILLHGAKGRPSRTTIERSLVEALEHLGVIVPNLQEWATDLPLCQIRSAPDIETYRLLGIEPFLMPDSEFVPWWNALSG